MLTSEGDRASALRCTVEPNGVATIVLDAPPLNILARPVLAELRRELALLAAEPTLRVLIVGATGRHFSAGASVEEHLPPEHEAMLSEFASTVLALREFPLPVLVAVRGRCLGGAFELVQAADIVVASNDAVFGQPEIVLGVLPPVACALLPPLVGPGRAAELIFTGDPMTAADAQAAGMVARVVPADAVASTTAQLAGRIARHSAAALRAAKRALRAAAPGLASAGIARANRVYLHELMATHDALEGLRAFSERRPPEWSHR